MTKLLQLLGWPCRHANTTWPFKDDVGNYVRCLDCGRRITHSWDDPISGIQAIVA